MSALTTRLPGKSSRTSTQAMSVPITALSTATTADDDRAVIREGGERHRRGHGLPEAGEPVLEGVDGERRERAAAR